MRTGSAVGVAFGAAGAAWLLGAPLSLWEVIGVQGLSLVWNLTGSNLRHSHVWLRYPTWLERVLISPAQHQIHHSNDERHFDRNFGSAFAVWDWAFGSLYIPQKREFLRFGLSASERNHEDRVVSALVKPVSSALSRFFPSAPASKVEQLPISSEASYH